VPVEYFKSRPAFGQSGNFMSRDTVAIASDHAGFAVKSEISELLHELGHDVLDLGADNSVESVDYPDFADAMAAAFAEGRVDRGVLICGTGIGISIAANRHRHLRAALCRDSTEARLARQHNDANVLVLGSRTGGMEQARDCVLMFLGTEFEGGRHQPRVKKMS
jgi:ribose 5-phosphate isomerase B